MLAEITYNTQAGPFWDWRIAADLFFGGAGVGALLFAVGVDEWFKGKYRRLCHTAAWLGPVLIAAGLILLMTELGRPFDLYKSYLNFNPGSPLWWGGIFQPIVVVGGFIYALRWQNRTEDDRVRRYLGLLLAPLAGIVGAYHGFLLAINVSRPLWNTGPAVLAAILGFCTTGIAAVMLVHLVRMKLSGRMADLEHVARVLNDLLVVRNVLVGAIVLQLGTFFLWWLSLQFGSLRDQQAMAAANEAYGPMFWSLGIGVGLVLPLLLGGCAVWRGEAVNRRIQIGAIATTSVLILIGAFFFRLAVVLGGQVELPIQTLS